MSRLTAATGIVVAIGIVAIGYPVVQEARAWNAYAEQNRQWAAVTADTLAVMDLRMRESSGLAVSRRADGVLWTHNDSGDGPVIYAFGSDGRVLRAVEVDGAEARDWEDMDAGPCPGAAEAATNEAARRADGADPVDAAEATDRGVIAAIPSRCLYLADTGDNGRGRDVLTVYVVDEPDPASPATEIPLRARLRFSYPDERHDAEMLAVHPDGTLVVVTKGRTGSIDLFTLDAASVAEAVAADRVVTLPAGRRLPIVPDWDLERVVTGGSFSPDGSTLAVRTYTEIFFLPWPLRAAGDEVGSRCFVGRLQVGGESLAYADDSVILLTSEEVRGAPGILLRVRCG